MVAACSSHRKPGIWQTCAAGAAPAFGFRPAARRSLKESEPLNPLGLGNPNGITGLGARVAESRVSCPVSPEVIAKWYRRTTRWTDCTPAPLHPD